MKQYCRFGTAIKEENMKRLTTSLIIICSAGSAQAAPIDDPAQLHDLCSKMSAVAETTMRHRQNGVPMREAMDLAERFNHIPPIKDMTLEAYNQKEHYAPEFKAKAATEFGNVWYKRCIDLHGK